MNINLKVKGDSTMESSLEIVRIVSPLLIAGGISIFVVYRMKHKYKNGHLGKKKTQRAQHLLDSLIPIGMLNGFVVSVLICLFFYFYFPYSIGIGVIIILFISYFVYTLYIYIRHST